MIKVLIVFLLITSHSLAHSACDRVIRVAYPPFVNLLTINKFFDGLHRELSQETGCRVEYALKKDFDAVLDSLIHYRHDAALLPGAYLPTAIELGYQVVSTVKRKNVIHVVSRKGFNGRELKEYGGLNILILGHFSESGARFEQALLDQNMLSKVNIEIGTSYERMMLAVMAKKADLAVIIPEYWMLLSADIRDKHLQIIHTLSVAPAGIVTRPGASEFSNVLIKTLNKQTKLMWEKPRLEGMDLPLLDQHIKNKVLDSLGK